MEIFRHCGHHDSTITLMVTSQKDNYNSVCRLIKRPLGQILVDGHFISPKDLEVALTQQKKTNKPLGELLVQLGMLDTRELKAVLSVQKDLASLKDAVKATSGTRQLLGELLLQSKRITPEQLDFALAEQMREGVKLGEVLVRLGFLTKTELNAILSFQKNQNNEASTSVRFRLGEILVAANIISRDQLEEALVQQMQSKKKIGRVLIEAGYVQPHLISYGLTLQRKLVTAALTAVLSLSTMRGFPEQDSIEVLTSNGTKLSVNATVQTRATLRVIRRPTELVVTNADVLRGYVDAPVTTRFEVKNNSPAGYLLTFDGPGVPFKKVQVRGLGRDIEISTVGGQIPQPYACGTFMMEMSYRFILLENAQPGTYAWPISISLSLM